MKFLLQELVILVLCGMGKIKIVLETKLLLIIYSLRAN